MDILSVTGAVVTAHHVAEVLTSAEGLRHALRLTECCCGRVWWWTSSCPSSLIHLFGSTPIIYSLLFAFIFFDPHNFNYFLSKHKILKIKEFQLKYLKFLEFKIYQDFKFSHPNTLLIFCSYHKFIILAP